MVDWEMAPMVVAVEVAVEVAMEVTAAATMVGMAATMVGMAAQVEQMERSAAPYLCSWEQLVTKRWPANAARWVLS